MVALAVSAVVAAIPQAQTAAIILVPLVRAHRDLVAATAPDRLALTMALLPLAPRALVPMAVIALAPPALVQPDLRALMVATALVRLVPAPDPETNRVPPAPATIPVLATVTAADLQD